MTYPRHLTRAPITEAVLDVAVLPVSGWREEVFAAFRRAAQTDFPDARPIQRVQTELAVNEAGDQRHSSASETLGWICWNSERTRAVQARVNGFSVNHVRSYKDWGALLEHAQDWWWHYRQAAAPVRVVRCGLRFINQFEIAPGEDLSATFRTRPELAPGLPQGLEEYFQRLVVPFPDGVRAAITQLLPRPDGPASARLFVLDIDVAVQVDLDASTDAFWSTFAELRRVKNQCFFESLEPAQWERFR